MTTHFVGLGHYARTGKDTLAGMIVEECRKRSIRAYRVSLAAKLKEIAHDLYGWAGLEDEAYYNMPEHEHEREVVLSALGKSPRQIWVDLGTPAVREQVYEDTWIDYVLEKKRIGGTVIVVPDVRFPNEVEKLRRKNGLLVKVVRPGYGPGPNKPDRALLDYEGWDWVVGESGSLAELRRFAVDFVENEKWKTV